MKNILLFTFLAVIIFESYSQNEKSNIYSGGMLLLQPGYSITTNNHQDIMDTSFGLGGILRFYFFNYLTAGIYGGTQKTGYYSGNSKNSNLSLGYGGAFAGLSHKVNRFRFTASAFGGMGTIRNLHIENQEGNTLIDAYLYKHSAIIFSPIVSIDFAITPRLMLTSQAVYLVAHYNNSQKLLNPTFQVGVLFNR
jgi:hypothetical protein